MNESPMKTCLKFLFVLSLLCTKAYSQFDVTGIYTDYNGYWQSSSSSINATKPEKSHNLLAFTWNGITYSTGVNDGILTSKGVSFSAKDFRALPIDAVPSTSSTYLGLGQLNDGINNGYSVPAPFHTPASGADLAAFLTDGIKGLDLGTCVANIATGQLRFNLSASGISPSAINDNVPDVLVTQVASPSATLDSIYFVDASGNVVGNKMAINQTAVTVTGKWMPDFYNPNGTIVFTNSERDIRLWGADLSSFGINSANSSSVVALIYRLNGQSDVAFVAFNAPSLSVATKLGVTTQPSSLTNPACCGNTGSTALVQQPVLQVMDEAGNLILQAGIPVTASIFSGPVGTGTLAGTTTVVTNNSGAAIFTNLVMPCDTGTYILTFTSSNLSPANSNTVLVARPVFYVKPAGINQLGTLSSWSSAPDGSGSVPANFGAGNEFVLTNTSGNSTFNTGTNWTVAGKLSIPAGKTLNITAGTTTTLSCEISHHGDIESGTGATLVLNGTNLQVLEGISNLKNLTISNASGVTLSENTRVDISLLLSTGVLKLDSSTLTINGSVTKSAGSINATSIATSIVYSGAVAQSLSPAAYPGGISNLTINNAAGVTISSDLIVINNLNLTSGRLKVNNFNITVGSVTGGNTSTYVQTNGTGKLRMSIPGVGASKNFPIGNSTYNPVFITNDNTEADQYSARVLDEVYVNSLSGAVIPDAHIIRTWQIQRSLNISPSGSSFVFNWTPAQNNGVTHPVMYHYFSSLWSVANSGISSSPTATSLLYSGYNEMAIYFAVIESSAILPVPLFGFSAGQQNKSVILDWYTSHKELHYSFIIERSADGRSWKDIGIVQATGNQAATNSYQFDDIAPMSGDNFYRLRQINKDRRYMYSEVRLVKLEQKHSFEVLGNPVVGATIKIRVDEMQHIALYDINGRMKWYRKFTPGIHSVPTSGLVAGTYYLKSETNGLMIQIPR